MKTVGPNIGQPPPLLLVTKLKVMPMFRFKCDEAYLVGAGQSPVGAYLDVASIVAVAAANGVQAIHPGYGFLSERADFAAACAQQGIAFVGPTVANLATFGDKTAARAAAVRCGVSVVPGSPGPIATVAAARAFIEQPQPNGEVVGYPVICKATMGGGGRGMRWGKHKYRRELMAASDVPVL
jgi:pyruvate carboxylase